MFLFNVFPGIIYMFLRNVYFFKNSKTRNVYLIALITVDLISLLVLKEYKLIIFISISIIVPYIYIIFEKIPLNSRKMFHNIKESNSMFNILILFPIFEELNFRFILFKDCYYLNLNNGVFLLVSILSFLITHLIYQGINALKKIPFSILQAILIMLTYNIWIIIITHIIFNILVFIEKSNSSYKKNNLY